MRAEVAGALRATSRSFHLSLRVLPASLREPIGLGYLLCRIADTLADTGALVETERATALAAFRNIFDGFPVEPGRATTFLHDLPFAEKAADRDRQTLACLPSAIQDLRDLSRSDQALIQEVVLGVIRGMEVDLTGFGTAEHPKALESRRDLEDYLLSIGGEPGRFWSKLLLNHGIAPRDGQTAEWMQRGIDFGKGLQMVNILRDLPEDLRRGRCYLPSEVLSAYSLTAERLLDASAIDEFRPALAMLIDETLRRLENGLFYLQSLPRTAWRLRMPVWWPLSFGVRTLARIRMAPNPLDPAAKPKITRGEVYRVLALSGAEIFWDRWLEWDFEDLAGEASSGLRTGYRTERT